MGGGEGEAPSSDGLPNVGNGVADILLVVVAIVVVVVVVVLLVGSAWSAWHCRSKSVSQQRVQSSTLYMVEMLNKRLRKEETASVIAGGGSASAWWERRARQTTCYCRLSFFKTSFLETF